MTSFGKSFIPYRENAAITFMKKRGRVRGYHSDGVRSMLERRPEVRNILFGLFIVSF